MMITITSMFVSVAELSNIFSVLAVLICLCAMVLFIMRNMMVFRLHGEDLVFGVPVHPQQTQIPQMKMMKVHIPFTFKLQETSQSSYSAVQCVASSNVEYTLQAFWGVSIRELHLLLWRPWSVLQAQVCQGNLLQWCYQQKGVYLQNGAHGCRTATLFLPEPPLELGTPPRTCYPLVVFLVRADAALDAHPDETVALINVIHIRDAVCTLPTSILAQYLKQANGQLSSLKQLYLASGIGPSLVDEPAPSTSAAADEDDDSPAHSAGGELCVVCQHFPLSRALLPCRHTCVCASCFARLERCPMCRCPIRSFFCIRGEEYMPPDRGPEDKPTRLAHFVQGWNDRLTDFLGFQR